MGINLRGVFLCAKAAHPTMAASVGGKVINIGSMTSLFGSDWVASYSASKGGVVQLTKSLGKGQHSGECHTTRLNTHRPGRGLRAAGEQRAERIHNVAYPNWSLGRARRPRRCGGVPCQRSI